MYNLSKLTLSNMTLCGRELRAIGANSSFMEEVAENISQYFYENMAIGDSQEKAIAIARVFFVLGYKELPGNLQSFAKVLLGDEKENPDMQCLTLLGTRGDKAEWNSRHTSSEHKAVPLVSVDFVKKIPMISALINQFGLELENVLDKSIVYNEANTFNVFYVENAKNSPLVPHQEDFVYPSNIGTVLGFGGLLPSGHLFVTILFTKIIISKEIANLFRPLALSVKLALIPFEQNIFKS